MDILLTVVACSVIVVTPIIGVLVTRIKVLTEQRNSWESMAKRAIIRLREEIQDRRLQANLALTPGLAAVIPEHSSPPSDTQITSADIATWRAMLVAAELDSTMALTMDYDNEVA